MLKRTLVFLIAALYLTACASWFGSSQENPDTPAVGGNTTDNLFGQPESAPAKPAASAPLTNTSSATNNSVNS